MWRKVTLSDVCTLRNGRAYKKPELLSDGKYPVLRVGNFFTSDKWYYSDLELDDTKYCDKGDLLYAWSASFGARMWEGEKVIYHYHIWRVDVDVDLIDKKFLYYWFEFDKEQIKKESGTGTTMIHVSKGSMEKREIWLPPLAEQQRIVAKLEAAFAEIELQVQAAKETITLSETNLANIIDAKTAGDSSWTEFKVMDLGVVQTGNTPKTSQKDNYGVDVPFVKPPHFNTDGTITLVEHGLSPKGAEQSRCAAANSVLMVCIGTIGKVGVNDIDVCFNQQINSLTPSADFDTELIYWQMRGKRFQNDVLRNAGQATLPIISKSKWQNLSVFLPQSKDEQIKIRHQLRELNTETENLIANKVKKIDNLQALKSVILAQELQSEAA